MTVSIAALAKKPRQSAAISFLFVFLKRPNPLTPSLPAPFGIALRYSSETG
jgi:hypothetical protein